MNKWIARSAFAIALLSTIGQIISYFLLGAVSQWVGASASGLTIVTLIIGVYASKRSTLEQIEQRESERKAREEGDYNEKWARRIHVGIWVFGTAFAVIFFSIGGIRYAMKSGYDYANSISDQVLREIKDERNKK